MRQRSFDGVRQRIDAYSGWIAGIKRLAIGHLKMDESHSALRQLKASTMLTVRELALAADLAAWAGDEDRSTGIIARIYDVFDDLDEGLAPHASIQTLVAGTAAWIGGRPGIGAFIACADEMTAPGTVQR